MGILGEIAAGLHDRRLLSIAAKAGERRVELAREICRAFEAGEEGTVRAASLSLPVGTRVRATKCKNRYIDVEVIGHDSTVPPEQVPHIPKTVDGLEPETVEWDRWLYPRDETHQDGPSATAKLLGRDFLTSSSRARPRRMSPLERLDGGLHDRELIAIQDAVAERRIQMAAELVRWLEPGDWGVILPNALPPLTLEYLPSGIQVRVVRPHRRNVKVQLFDPSQDHELKNIPPEVVEWERWQYAEPEGGETVGERASAGTLG